MKKLFKLEEIVKTILKEEPSTRADDMLLYYRYAIRSRRITKEKFKKLFTDSEYRKKTGLSTVESVGRCRRKIQQMNPELRPSAKVQDARSNETSEYIDYAIGGYNGGFVEYVNAVDKEKE